MIPGDLSTIVDFQQRFAAHPIFRGRPQQDFVDYVLYKYNEHSQVRVAIGERHRGQPSKARARVEPALLEIAPLPVGRWIVDCADPACNGAEYVDFTSGVFMCCSCWNVAVGHRWLQHDLPAPGLRLEIERLLLQRHPTNRVWLPTEGIVDLRMQNIQLGVPV